MAPPPTVSISSSEPPKLHASDIRSIKTFANANGSPISSSYYSIVEARDDIVDHLASSIPTIDFSLLTSDLPQLHADAVSQLSKVMNHGISEKLMEKVVNKAHEFHNLPVEEKKEFRDKGP